MYNERELISAEHTLDNDNSASDIEYIIEAEIEQAPKRKKKTTESFHWSQEDIPKIDFDLNFVCVTNDKILNPIEYFAKLFTFDIMNDIIDQTNLYSTQQRGVSINTNAKELTYFISYGNHKSSII